MNHVRWLLRQIFLIPVYLYKGILSPFFGPSCRYTPSCSTYMVEAVERHGVFKGGAMGIARIFRCSGRFWGGHDPVPESWSWQQIKDGYTLFRKKKSSL
ncbi:MAG TPA: membrane protein insertion efficiency factor YidD [Sphaerochaeta sp.]|nr:membrane protein insertion efficiency factor YidD [Sphaerochaeta sp.]